MAEDLHRARILAQLAHGDRAMNVRALAEALGWEEPDVAAELRPLVRAGLARSLRLVAAPGHVLYECTERGRLEAAGGAQMRIDGAPDRPPVDLQPALF